VNVLADPYLAIERIRKAEFVQDRDKDRVRFTYPKSYDPQKHIDGTFGLRDGPETDVEFLLLANTEEYLRSRVIYPTQRFRRRRDGQTMLTMQVRGTIELRNFILGLGPWVKVVKPPALRKEVSKRRENGRSLQRPRTLSNAFLSRLPCCFCPADSPPSISYATSLDGSRMPFQAGAARTAAADPIATRPWLASQWACNCQLQRLWNYASNGLELNPKDMSHARP